jgi:hypothetical protein
MLAAPLDPLRPNLLVLSEVKKCRGSHNPGNDKHHDDGHHDDERALSGGNGEEMAMK